MKIKNASITTCFFPIPLVFIGMYPLCLHCFVPGIHDSMAFVWSWVENIHSAVSDQSQSWPVRDSAFGYSNKMDLKLC